MLKEIRRQLLSIKVSSSSALTAERFPYDYEIKEMTIIIGRYPPK